MFCMLGIQLPQFYYLHTPYEVCTERLLRWFLWEE